jgi:excinuclease ABC subunit A
MLGLYGINIHNLHGVDVEIPSHKLCVITGVSGSGKSSLAFDTIYSEGSFRYLETLSGIYFGFIKKNQRPAISHSVGLSPTISVSQTLNTYKNRTTIGKIVEIENYLKILFSQISKPFCNKCSTPIFSHDIEDVIKEIFKLFTIGDKLIFTAVLKSELTENLKNILLEQGFTRILVNNIRYDLDENIEIPEGEILIIIDRIKLKSASTPRIAESIEFAYKLSKGELIIIKNDEQFKFTEKPKCVKCGFTSSPKKISLFSRNSLDGACDSCNGEMFINEEICKKCGGTGFNKNAISYKYNDKNIYDILSFSIDEALKFFKNVSPSEKTGEKQLIKPVIERLSLLSELNLNHLKIEREMNHLSRGEKQLIKIAAHLSSPLTGVTYIFDEPTQGLTKTERPLILNIIKKLLEKNNSVILVEHDFDFLKAADHIIEMGPKAGINGGKIVFEGSYDELLKSENSITGRYINKELLLPSTKNINNNNIWFGFNNGNFRNLVNLDISLPWKNWSVINGKCGAGKTSILELLFNSLKSNLNVKNSFGNELFPGGINFVDSKPISNHSHSTIVSYIKIWENIRHLFSLTKLSKLRGYLPSRFSTKIKGGACVKCSGLGKVKINLGKLSDFPIECDKCEGKRFNKETLDIKYRGKNISDILNLTIDESGVFFVNHPKIVQKIIILQQIGLGYLQLGQNTNTLSGGERQRLKLSRDLLLFRKKPSLYLLDEPTTGLHPHDISKLILLFQKLCDEGHTLVTTDHSQYLKNSCDYHLIIEGKTGEILSSWNNIIH